LRVRAPGVRGRAGRSCSGAFFGVSRRNISFTVPGGGAGRFLEQADKNRPKTTRVAPERRKPLHAGAVGASLPGLRRPAKQAIARHRPSCKEQPDCSTARRLDCSWPFWFRGTLSRSSRVRSNRVPSSVYVSSSRGPPLRPIARSHVLRRTSPAGLKKTGPRSPRVPVLRGRGALMGPPVSDRSLRGPPPPPVVERVPSDSASPDHSGPAAAGPAPPRHTLLLGMFRRVTGPARGPAAIARPSHVSEPSPDLEKPVSITVSRVPPSFRKSLPDVPLPGDIAISRSAQ